MNTDEMSLLPWLDVEYIYTCRIDVNVRILPRDADGIALSIEVKMSQETQVWLCRIVNPQLVGFWARLVVRSAYCEDEAFIQFAVIELLTDRPWIELNLLGGMYPERLKGIAGH